MLEPRASKGVIAFWKRIGYKDGTTQPIRQRVASVDLRTFAVTEIDGYKLSDIEKLEIRQAIDHEQLYIAQEKAVESAIKAMSGLRELNPNFDFSAEVKNDPDSIWRGIGIVEKALKAAGYERPKKSRVDKVPDTKTGDLLKK